MCNKKLINLDGLENHTSLVYVFAQRCNLQSIQGLKGNVNLKYITKTNINILTFNNIKHRYFNYKTICILNNSPIYTPISIL